MDSGGREVVVYEGSLAGHVMGSDRAAVPIYPHDAQTIVNMMDLHFDPSADEGEGDGEPFEIFEAGTGAGSLTIHIARAIHAANPPLPRELRDALPRSGIQLKPPPDESPPETAGAGRNISHIPFHDEHLSSTARAWVGRRRAILHTLDHKPAHTLAAQTLIRKFRRGLYLPHIDFHNGSLSAHLTPRLRANGSRPFLSRAVLDLPAPEREAGSLIPCLHPNAVLVVFAPSISQIGDFVKWSTLTRQELRLDRVAELQTSSTSEFGIGENEGGRAWRVQTVRPRKYARDRTGREHVPEASAEEEAEQPELVQIMRPKVGERVCGGGFVAVLRKTRPGEQPVVEEVEVEEAGESTRPGQDLI